jgi:hypothetical protein
MKKPNNQFFLRQFGYPKYALGIRYFPPPSCKGVGFVGKVKIFCDEFLEQEKCQDITI